MAWCVLQRYVETSHLSSSSIASTEKDLQSDLNLDKRLGYPYRRAIVSRCPVLERGFVFYWSLVFTLIFPIGIPVGLTIVLYRFRVPQIARQKEKVRLSSSFRWKACPATAMLCQCVTVCP